MANPPWDGAIVVELDFQLGLFLGSSQATDRAEAASPMTAIGAVRWPVGQPSSAESLACVLAEDGCCVRSREPFARAIHEPR